MSNNRHPSSRPPERDRDSERRAYDYSSDKDFRAGKGARPSSARNTSQRPPQRPSSRDDAPRSSARPPYRDEAARSSARSPYRDEAPRSSARSPYRDAPQRGPDAGRSGNARPSSQGQGNRRPPARRPVRRGRPILPLIVAIAVLAAIVVILRFTVFNGGKDTTEYRMEFSAPVMVVGSTATASVVGVAEDSTDKISWSTNDGEAVSVKNGLLTAKRVKDAVTISATVNGKTVTGTVKVIEKVEGVKALTLNPAEISILSGKTQQIKYTITFEPGVEQPAVQPIWTSSNVAVVTVSSDGLVTARDVGSASITATLGNQSAVCSVTVAADPDGSVTVPGEEDLETEPPATQEPEANNTNNTTTPPQTTTPPATNTGGTSTAPSGNAGTNGNTAGNTNTNTSTTKPQTVDSINISQTIGFLEVGQTMELSAGVEPASIALTWATANPAIATVTADGKVTAVGVGSVVISASAGGRSVSCTVQVDAATTVPEA